MQVFKGLPVSPGIVIGRVLVVGDEVHHVPRRPIAAAAVPAQIARLEAAIAASIQEIKRVHERAHKEMGADTADIFKFHISMLSDPALVGQIKAMIGNELVTAEYATDRTLASLADRFRVASDSVFATKINDIDDLGSRLLAHLVGAQQRKVASPDAETIVVARDLTPSQTAGFDRTRILGFATDLGGMTSHTAIIAKALDIPAVVGCQNLLRSAYDGTPVILDGDKGTVLLNPDEAALADYRRYIEQRRLFRVSLSELTGLPSVTLDGVQVHTVGNIELPEEVDKVLKMGGEGIGLYRTEYLYLTKNTEPSEEDHFNAYKRCIELAGGREVVIRTVDLGADKYTQAREEVPERNPFLGNRSIRYCLRSVPMFKRQLRAILRASALGPIKMMFPLISNISELRQAKFLVNDVMEDLDEEGLRFNREIDIGMMVEVPSAAIQADSFARECDFFSIGTNDLVQYTLAVDRINERVAHLYRPTHPAVVRLIRDVVRAARRHQTPVSCCGEAAGDLEYAMLLIGLGLRTLSVTSSAIPQLKRFIRSVTVQQCERVAKQALTLDSDVQVTALLRDRARQIVPEAFDGRSAD
jgi:phosphotransferase system enzyme I (PtsI)